uniref:Secreted protein n=1 Tax=Anguilla anguilla TaxID=7936 RepID=A0A0E9WK41_ANGAN
MWISIARLCCQLTLCAKVCCHGTECFPHKGLVKQRNKTKQNKGWSNNLTVHKCCNCTAAKNLFNGWIVSRMREDSLQKVEIGTVLLDIKGIQRGSRRNHILHNMYSQRLGNIGNAP